jgi:outer membrane protein assembly factor BamB
MIKSYLNFLILVMSNFKKIFFILIFILLNNCSFDSKTGIWDGSVEEPVRIVTEEEKKNIVKKYKVYSTDSSYLEEKRLLKSIILSKPSKNSSWKESGLNLQNNTGNMYLPYPEKVFLKKKVGANKFSIYKLETSLLEYQDHLILSDDRGTIFKINNKGKIIWKQNIYKKLYKRIYKNLIFSINKKTIYVADNIGFIYAVDISSGKVIWIKNHGVPIKSNIKILNENIYLLDQDNKVFALNKKDGTQIWNIISISSFIKSQKLLSLAISKNKNLISINSSGDLFSINSINGEINWATNISGSLYLDASDFFQSTDIVLTDKEIIFSDKNSTYSFSLIDGSMNWVNKLISSTSTPIIVKENIFLVTENGMFVILEKSTGEILSSTNILKVLKKRDQETLVTNFIIGSGKIYSTTLNGKLIVSSATSGKVENFKKISDSLVSSLIISNGKIFILSENSRVLGLN